MNVNSDLTGLGTDYLAAARANSGTAKFSRSSSKQEVGSSYTDIVDISELYRSFQLEQADQLTTAQSNLWTTGESTKGKFSGSDINGLRNFIQETGMGLDLSSINASRQTVGRRLNDVIKKAGIKLGKDEKISITIDGNNNVKVGGLKDSKRAKEIEKAIANDDKLTQDIRRHYAQGKVNKDIQTMNQSMGDVENASDVFTSRNLRAFVIDDYLQQKTGATLADLSSEDGVISGVSSEVAALFAEDTELASTVQNILDNGEHKLGFSVSFEFQNGTITDSNSEDAAKEKMKAIQGLVIGLVDEYNDNLTKNNAGLSPEELNKMRIESVKIRADASGGYEVVNADTMDQSKVDAIMRIVARALELYAGDDLPEDQEAIDAFTGGKATGNFVDVVETFTESHRLEDFDTEEFPHEVEMELNSLMGKPEIVSEAADKAREEVNGELGKELGQELRAVLEEEGVNVGAGIEVEVDADGKIKVVGDLSDPNLQKAQRVLDTFSKDALGAKGDPEGNGLTKKLEEEISHGGLQYGHGSTNTNTGNADKIKRTQELNNETNPGGTSSPNVAKFERPEYTDREDDEASAAISAAAVAARYRDNTSTNTFLSGGSTSRIQAPRYATSGDDANYVLRPNEGPDNDPYSSIWNEYMLYPEDATGIFQHMVDSLNQFHDGDRSRKISFTIM